MRWLASAIVVGLAVACVVVLIPRGQFSTRCPPRYVERLRPGPWVGAAGEVHWRLVIDPERWGLFGALDASGVHTYYSLFHSLERGHLQVLLTPLSGTGGELHGEGLYEEMGGQVVSFSFTAMRPEPSWWPGATGVTLRRAAGEALEQGAEAAQRGLDAALAKR